MTKPTTNPPDASGQPDASGRAVRPEPPIERRARQRERFGGVKFGAATFGWLVAVGLTVLLVAVAGTVAVAVGGPSTVIDRATPDAGLAGAVVLLVLLMVAYFAGGYVAGRLARFDGARNGLATWFVGLLVTIVATVGTALSAGEYSRLANIQWPAVPVTVEALTVTGTVAALAVVLGTMIAAVLGGKAGERFHRKVDRVGADIG